jgi:hypothetical protein
MARFLDRILSYSHDSLATRRNHKKPPRTGYILWGVLLFHAHNFYSIFLRMYIRVNGARNSGGFREDDDLGRKCYRTDGI